MSIYQDRAEQCPLKLGLKRDGILIIDSFKYAILSLNIAFLDNFGKLGYISTQLQ